MATKIKAAGDTIKISKTFVSGRDRLTINGEVVCNDLGIEEPETFAAGNRAYTVEINGVSKMTGAFSTHLKIHEDGQLLHSGIYDQHGKPVQSEREAKANGAVHYCCMIGAVIGCATMSALSFTTGVVPGGAIGGAIGGGVGGAIGVGIGKLLFSGSSK